MARMESTRGHGFLPRSAPCESVTAGLTERHDLEGGENPKLDAHVVLPVRGIDKPVHGPEHERAEHSPQRGLIEALGLWPCAPPTPQQAEENDAEGNDSCDAELHPEGEPDVMGVQRGHPAAKLVGVSAEAYPEDGMFAEHLQ